MATLGEIIASIFGTNKPVVQNSAIPITGSDSSSASAAAFVNNNQLGTPLLSKMPSAASIAGLTNPINVSAPTQAVYNPATGAYHVVVAPSASNATAYTQSVASINNSAAINAATVSGPTSVNQYNNNTFAPSSVVASVPGTAGSGATTVGANPNIIGSPTGTSIREANVFYNQQAAQGKVVPLQWGNGKALTTTQMVELTNLGNANQVGQYIYGNAPQNTGYIPNGFVAPSNYQQLGGAPSGGAPTVSIGSNQATPVLTPISTTAPSATIPISVTDTAQTTATKVQTAPSASSKTYISPSSSVSVPSGTITLGAPFTKYLNLNNNTQTTQNTYFANASNNLTKSYGSGVISISGGTSTSSINQTYAT